MSAPPYLLACISLILVSWHSDRVMERGFHVALPVYGGAIGYALMAIVHDSPVIQYTIICWTTASTLTHVAPAVYIFCFMQCTHHSLACMDEC